MPSQWNGVVEKRPGMEMPKDLKRGIDRQNKFMRNLMHNNVYTKT